MFEEQSETTEATETPEKFSIDSESAADWLLRKLANIEAEKARVKAYAAERTAELDADANRLNSRFGEQLRTWAEGESARRRRREVTLPNGKICFRTENPRLVIADNHAATKYAEDMLPDAIRETVTLDTAAYRKAAEAAFAETGELWPGIERTEAKEGFSIRFLKGGSGKEQSPDEPDVI